MKCNFVIFLVGLLSTLSAEVYSQDLIPNFSVTGVSLAGNKTNRIYIPPPRSFLERSGLKGGGRIIVTYSGFTAQARAAVQFAVSILESVLPSGTKINLKVSCSTISKSGVLGNSSITGFVTGSAIDALNPGAFYPITVAEKIAGKSFNPDSDADIELVVNNSANWYYGTDGNTPPLQYDLVTVVLHELCHGLGFFDSMVAGNTIASYGLNFKPLVFDTFVENLSGQKLTDTALFEQNSNGLYLQLVGGQLYFSAPLTDNYTSGIRPRLYAPSTWDEGSSVSHLDETRTSQINSLMTPYIDKGEAIHDPGKLTMSILGDIGWINTRILHEEIKDTEDHLTALDVTAEIKSDTTYDKNRVGLVYSFDDFITSDTLMMIASSSGNIFTRELPIPSYNIGLDYYFFTGDVFHRLYRSPSLAEKDPYTVFIGTDTVRPVIKHTPVEYYFEMVDSVLFETTVTDNLGIDTVYIEYTDNDGPVKYLGLSASADDVFINHINVKNELLKGGDLIQYRIIAVDKAAINNIRISPSSGYYSIKIESLGPELIGYSTDFSDAENDFLNSGFRITQPSGFASPGLHSDHPYESPDEDGASLEFSSILRCPIRFSSSGMVISFMELVLVEPGEEGSAYGFSDFYDYVVVEGSNDYGISWFSLADGYDSRIIPAWEDGYGSSADGQNSTYTGTEPMMVKHTIYPALSDKISDGAPLLLRFRLFSDSYAHGWGWVIDDLNITPLIDQIDETGFNELTLFPNPGRGLMNIRSGSNSDAFPLFISIYNSMGQCIFSDRSFTENEISLDISDSPSGLYLIAIKKGRSLKILKYSLIK